MASFRFRSAELWFFGLVYSVSIDGKLSEDRMFVVDRRAAEVESGCWLWREGR